MTPIYTQVVLDHANNDLKTNKYELAQIIAVMCA